MSSKFSWIRKLADKWLGRTSGKSKRRPLQRSFRPKMEELEVRLVPAGTLSLSGTTLTLADSGSPTVAVSITSSNYTISDSAGISGTITGWTISGTMATETNAGAASITKIIFNTTNATFNATTFEPATAVAITDAGSVTISGAMTGATTGALNISAAGSIADNASITLTTGTVTIAADTAGSGTAGFTQSAGTITTTATSASAMSITVNTAGGGTGNASLSKIADSGTLTVNAHGGSILYTSTDTLDAEQSANYTLFPGITGPAPSLTGGGPNGSTGAAPTTGTVNALHYVFTTTGSGSIGTAASPINTSTPASNTETLSAGSGGIYFVDWGNPLTLDGASATGGNVEVVAANASGHNLTVAGNVTDVGSGNIVLAADDNFIVNSGETIGETSGTGFTGDVYLACNRDTGNTETLTDAGTITTSSTSSSAVVIEGFHDQANGTSAGLVSVANVTTGSGITGGGGTITVDTVPYDMTNNLTLGGNANLVGQGVIVAASSSTVLNAGANGTVDFLVNSMEGLSNSSSAVGTSTTPMAVTAGTVNVTANVGLGGTAEGDNVYVTDTIGGNFSATTGSTSPSGSINLTTTSGVLTVSGATNTGNNAAINLTSTGTGGGITVSGVLGSVTTGTIAVNAGSNNVTFTAAQTFGNNDPVTITAGNAADIQSNVSLTGSAVAGGANGILVDTAGSLSWGTSGATITGPVIVSGSLAPNAFTYATLSVSSLTLNSSATTEVNLNADANGNSQIDVSGTATLGGNIAVNASGSNLVVGDTFTILTATSISGVFANAASITSGLDTFSASVVGDTVVLTVTFVSENSILDVPSSGVVTFTAAGTNNDNIAYAVVNGNYVISDPTEPITLTTAASNAGWTNTDGNGNANAYDASIPTSYAITSLTLNTGNGADIISGIAAGSANVSISGSGVGTLEVEGAITTTGTISILNYTAVDFEGSVSGSTITVTGATSITGNSTGGAADSLTGSTVAFTGTGSTTINDTIPVVGNLAISGYNSVDFEGNATATNTVSATGTFTISGATSGATTMSNGVTTVYPENLSAATLAITGSAGSGNLDFEGNVTIAGNISISGGFASITDGASSDPGTLTGNTITISGLASTASIGTSNNPLLTAGTTINAAAGSVSGNIYISQTGSATFTATAAGSGSISLVDPNAADTLTIGGTTSTATGSITISCAGAIQDNANITVTTGTIFISADTAGSGTAGFTEATGATITSTNTSSAAISITVNTGGGGTGNASIQAIADSGTLSVTTYGGSILYAGTNTLDAQQSATYTLYPGSAGNPAITGPAPSLSGTTTGPLGSSGSAPSGGTVNALNYSFTTTGSGSIGTAARPINTDTPASNTETFSAGSGGIYFVDWGNPLTLNGATATGGNIEVVAANASGHNLTVAGNVTDVGSGNIVLAADDNFTIASGITVGETSGTAFTGDVYIACNRDTGNTETIADSGTITTSNTTANAVVIEGFHAQASGSSAGTVSVGNVTTGSGIMDEFGNPIGGGTITVSTVPYDMTNNNTLGAGTAVVGQGVIVTTNSSDVFDAGPNGSVDFLVTSMEGLSNASSAVGLVGTPMTVTAGTVNVTANVGAGGTAEGDDVFVTDTIGGDFTATTGSTSPSGTINLGTTSGVLTVSGATNTGSSSAITLTSTGTGGGIVVSAPLGSSTTGAIALNAGSNGVQFTSAETFTSNDTVTVTSGTPAEITSTGTVTVGTGTTFNSTAGVQVDNGGTLAGTGTVNTGTSQLNVDGTLAPSVTTAGLDTDPLTLQSDGTLQVTINGVSQYSVVNVAGTLTLNDPNLVIETNSVLSSGDSFTIMNATGGVTGTFGSSSYTSSSGYGFTVSYVGNTVVITVTSAPQDDFFDVTSGAGTFTSAPGINNNLTVTNTGQYSITDASEPILLTANAMAAGWTQNGPNSVVGPIGSITAGLTFYTEDGSDAFTTLLAASANVTITGSTIGSLAIDGPVTTAGTVAISGYTSVDFEGNVTATGNITISGVANVTDNTGAATLTGATLSITASSGVGTSAEPLLTAGTTITATAGAGGVYVSQTGSANFTGTATGAGNISLLDTGAVTVAGATSTATGNISISATGAVADNASINAGSGTIAINANTAGSGTDGYTQATAASLTTTNTTTGAVTINVNTAGGGTGTAKIGNATVGSSSGGYYNVNANAGMIIWNETTVQARGTSGVPTNVINAYGFAFNDTGTGGIGTSALPLQITGPIENDPFSASAGSGGIFATDFGTEDLQLNQAIAAGGNINIETNNAGGHDMLVNGTVFTGNGNITLYTDDDLILNGVNAPTFDVATIGTEYNALIGGPGFGGTVDLEANLDTANADPVYMEPGSSIFTTNATSSAVLIESYSAAGGVSPTGNILNGGVQLSNVTVGAGGTITVNAAAGTATAREGSIVQLPGTLLDTSGGSGTVYGTVVLSARADDTSGDSNATVAEGQGNIGVGGTVSAPVALPILVKAATVTATTTGTNLANTGYIAISDDVAGTFTATTSGNANGSITLTTTGGALTIGGATTTAGGTVTLTGAGGVVLNATLGNTATGAIAINGPLSGSGNIQLGTGGLTETQNTNSSYAGAISGAAGDAVSIAGTGALTLTGTSTYSGSTTVSAGSLIVNGSLSGTASAAVNAGSLIVNGTVSAASGVTISGTGLLAGSGTISGPVSSTSIIAPGGGTGGTAVLTTGNLTLGSGDVYEADLTGEANDELNVNGTASLGGALSVNVGSGLTIGQQFTIISSTGAISGQFTNGSSVDAANNAGYQFTITYGTNTVVLTLANIFVAPYVDVENGEVIYESLSGGATNLTVSNTGTTYTVADANGSAVNYTINLTAGALAAGWYPNGDGSVSGPTSYTTGETTIDITSLELDLYDATNAITLIQAGSVSVAIAGNAGSGPLTVNGPISNASSVAISGFSAVDFENTVNATGAITVTGAASITGNTAGGTTGTLTASTVSFAGTGAVTVGDTIPVDGNLAISSYSSVDFEGNATATNTISATGTFTISGATTLSDGVTTVYPETLSASTVAITGSGGALDFEGNLTATGNVTVSGYANLTDGTAGTPGSLGGTVLSLTATSGIGSAAHPLLTAGTTSISATGGAGGVYVAQTAGDVHFSAATATGAGNVSLGDTDPNGTLNIDGAPSVGTGNIIISAAGAVADNVSLTYGTTTAITISADTAGSGTAGFTQATGTTITSTNTGTSAISITVNTAGGGTGDANIRTIADSGTLTVNAHGGSILYAGTDTLDVQQSAIYTLYPGITGPAPSGTGAGGTGAAPAGTVNALHYVFSTTGGGSIGTAARPINTTSPSSNTELLNAGSGGVYFVDWGSPLTLSGASATGGGVEVVAANAGGHNLTVAGNVTDTGSGNIVLAADDNFVVNSGVTIGGASFSGDVYCACNRDTGNTETVTIDGSIITSNTTASAVVVEGFHAAGNGTAAGVVAVNNITTGNGGTITISTVPYNLATGQGSIAAVSSSSVLNAGANGTVDFIATTMAGNSSETTAVGTAATPIKVTAGNVNITANSGVFSGATSYADSVFVTDTIGGNFSATTGSASPSGTINLTTTSGVLTVSGATNTGTNSAINLTSTGAGGGIVVSGPLGSSTTGAIALNAGSNGVQFTGDETLTSNEPVTVTAGTPAEITSTSTITLSDGSLLTSASGVQVDNGGTLGGTGTVNTGSNQLNVDGTLAPSVSVAGLNTDLTFQSDGTLQVTLDGTSSGNFSQVNVSGAVALNNATLDIIVGTPLSVGDSFEIIDSTGAVAGAFGNASFTSSGYVFSVTYNTNSVVLTVTSVPTTDVLDVQGSDVDFTAPPGVNNNLTVSLTNTENGNYYTINDSAVAITLTNAAVAAGWTNTDANGNPNPNDATGPVSYVSNSNTINITSLSFNTQDGSDTISSIDAGSADVSISGYSSGTLDFEGDVTTTGDITVSGYYYITDGAAGISTPGTLTGNTVSLSADGIGYASLPVLTAATTVIVAPGAEDGDVTQTSGSVNFIGTATGSANLNLSDTDQSGMLTISGATSSQSGSINLTSAGTGIVIGSGLTSTSGAITATETGSGDITDNGAITSTNGNITLTSSNNIIDNAVIASTSGNITLSSNDNTTDNANIDAGTGSVTIDANTAGSGTAGFTQAVDDATITAGGVTINVNSAGGGTGNASIRTIADSGTLTINTNAGSILYAGTDTLDAQQSANYTLVPGSAGNPAITGPAPSLSGSGSGPAGSSGSSPTGTVNALSYSFTTTGNGSIGTPDRPINTSAPTSNTENFNAGSGGIYFVDWGSPMTLQGATAAGGDIEVVAANAGGHNLSVTGNVLDTGSGNIVLAADDNLTVNSNVIIGETSGTDFTGDVYLACNRDTGNTESIIDEGTITTSNTTPNAVVIEGFHQQAEGTSAGLVQLGDVTTGSGLEDGGGTITVDTVPYDMTLNSRLGQGDIVAFSNTSVLDAGDSGTVDLIATTMEGLSNSSSAIGLAATPITVTAGTVNITANVGAGGTAEGDNVYVTDTIGGDFTATTGSTSPSGSITLATTSGVLTVSGATNTGSSAPISLTSTAGIDVNAALGGATTGAIAINGPLSGSGSIQLGAGGLTVTQSTSSAYDGAISGGSGDSVTFTGDGALTLNADSVNTYAGSTTISGGSLIVNGSLTSTSGVTVSGTGLLAGSGTIDAPVSGSAFIAPGGAMGGIATLTTGSLTLSSGNVYEPDVNSTGNDQLNVTGTTVSLDGTLAINAGSGLEIGDVFTIINAPNATISGTFANAANGATIPAGNYSNYLFTVAYTANTVVVTLAEIVVPTVASSTASLPIDAATLTIDGTGFDPSAGNNIVTFDDGAAGTVTSATTTSLTVTFSTAPAALGVLTANVTTDSLTSGSPVQVATVIPALTTSTASLPFNSTTLTINGAGFDTTAGNNTVSFNDGAVGSVTSATATTLTVAFATAPSAVGSLTAVVTTDSLSSGAPVQVATVTPVVATSTANLPISATAVTIAGYGFDATAANDAVTFNDGAAGIVTSASATSLTVTLSMQPASVGNLTAVVTTDSISSGAPVQVATVVPVPPAVTVNTNTLPVNATTVTIDGAYFDPNSGNDSVTFNDGAVGFIYGATSTTLSVYFTTEPTTAGSLTAVVTANALTSGSPVQVATLTPVVTTSTASLESNATSVTIDGYGFDASAGNNLVAFNDNAAGIVTSATANSLTVTFTAEPTLSGSLTAVVTTDSVTSGPPVQVATVIQVPPTVTASTASLAVTSATVTIDGTGFDPSAGNNTVTFNDGAAGTVTSATGTSLTVTFSTQPVAAGSLTAVVTTDSLTSGSPVQVATVTTVSAPMVTLSTASLPANATTLTIDGTNFDSNPANDTVTLNDGASGIVTAATATTLTVTFTTQPVAAGSLTAVVTADSITSGSPVQVATVAPVVTTSTAGMLQHTPTLTIHGYGFDPTAGNNTVTFNDGAVGTVTSATATTLVVTFTTAPTAAGSLTAVVTTDSITSGAAVQVATVTSVTSVTVNADIAPIVDISSNGSGTVTATTDGNNGFTAGNTVVISGYTGANAGYDGTFTVQSASGDQFTVTNATAGLPTLSGNSAGFAISQNTASALRGNQRSMVDSVVYTFTAPVSLTASNFTLATSAPSVSGAPSSAPAPATLYPGMALTSLGGGSIWVVSWVSGDGTGATVSGHSLADGVYNITLGNSNEGTDTFFRLYGNVVGYNSISHTASLNNQDSLTFTHSYLLSTGATLYLADCDYDANGVINNTDSLNFTHRYLSVWSGFVPTI